MCSEREPLFHTNHSQELCIQITAKNSVIWPRTLTKTEKNQEMNLYLNVQSFREKIECVIFSGIFLEKIAHTKTIAFLSFPQISVL